MSKQADFYRQLASPKNRELFNDLLDPFGIEPPPRKISESEVLFNRFRELAYRVQECGTIVQNEGQTITEKEIAKWSKLSATVIVDLANLLTKTKAFLENQQR